MCQLVFESSNWGTGLSFARSSCSRKIQERPSGTRSLHGRESNSKYGVASVLVLSVSQKKKKPCFRPTNQLPCRRDFSFSFSSPADLSFAQSKEATCNSGVADQGGDVTVKGCCSWPCDFRFPIHNNSPHPSCTWSYCCAHWLMRTVVALSSTHHHHQ